MLTQNQRDLCERDGVTAASYLLTRLNQHLFTDVYASEAQRHAAALRVLGAFCDVFAGALDDAMGENRPKPVSLTRLLEAVIDRRRRATRALAARLDAQEAPHE